MTTSVARREDYEEFLLKPVGALRRYRDAEGRPVCGEAIVNDPGFREGLELRRCPYAGSRRGHELPMNVSALKQMTGNWSTILGAAHVVHALFVQGDGGRAVTPADVMRVAYAAVCLPLFLLYRAKDPIGEAAVPGFVSGLHKASIDVATTAQLMIVEGLASGCAATPSTNLVGTMLDLVERRGLFIGRSGVCAGPPHLVRQLIDVMVHGSVSPSDVERAREELGDLTGLVNYADELLRVWVARQLVAACRDRAAERWTASAVPVLAVPAPPGTSTTPTSDIIEHQARLLVSLEPATFTALLLLLDAGAGFVTWGANRPEADRLLACARAMGEQDPQHLAVARLASASESARDVDGFVGGLLGLLRLNQAALTYFASTEATIRKSLGVDRGAIRPLTSGELDQVFGASPAERLASAVGIAVRIDGAEASLSSPRGTVVLT